MIVEGSVLDADGVRSGYVRLRQGMVVEIGKSGTDSARGRERRVRGVVLPRPVNAHTHLADAVFDAEPPSGPLAAIVRPPNGLKFRLLAETPPRAKQAAMRRTLRQMAREGQAAAVDFREEGVLGVKVLRAAARGTGVRVVALGRPLRRPVDPRELTELLSVADGIGLSSAREEDEIVRDTVARACRSSGKRYAQHASEERREPVDEFLKPRPDLLVHLTCATEEDLAAVARARVPVAVCPRARALFGRVPDLAMFLRAGVRLLLGTDNAMLQPPSMFRELAFAYLACRLRKRPVDPQALVRAAFVEPWIWLGESDRSRIRVGTTDPLVLRLPPNDPAYQVVARATEQLIVPSRAA